MTRWTVLSVTRGEDRRIPGGDGNVRWPTLFRAMRPWLTSNEILVWMQVDACPDRLAPGQLYLLGERTNLWALVMLCPCGCGDTIQTNLRSGAGPCWQLTHHSDETVSLHPAIWRPNGCGSYVFVRRSRIYWWNTAPVESRQCSVAGAADVVQPSAGHASPSSLASATSPSAELLSNWTGRAIAATLNPPGRSGPTP